MGLSRINPTVGTHQGPRWLDPLACPRARLGTLPIDFFPAAVVVIIKAGF
jgi:hypothetical protein